MNLIEGNYYVLIGRYEKPHIFKYTGNRYVYSVQQDYNNPYTLIDMDIQLLRNERIVPAYPREVELFKRVIGYDTDGTPEPPTQVHTGSFHNTFYPVKYCVGQVLQYEDRFFKIVDIEQPSQGRQPTYALKEANGNNFVQDQQLLDLNYEVSDRRWSEIIKTKKGFRLW